MQIDQQRFLDVVPDQETCWAAPLDVLVKVEADKQKLALMLLDPDWMRSAKTVTRQGRTQEFGVMSGLVAVTLSSPTNDLRGFVHQHGTEKGVFSESNRMVFERK